MQVIAGAYIMIFAFISYVCVTTICVPTNTLFRALFVDLWHAMMESFDIGFINILLFLLSAFLCFDQGLSIFFMCWYHVGAVIGAPIYGVLAAHGRKKNKVLHILACICVYIAMSYMLRAINPVIWTRDIRRYMSNGRGGFRKIRTFRDPFAAKSLNGAFGFSGAFSPDINRLVLLCLFFGVANSSFAICQAGVCDVAISEFLSSCYRIAVGTHYHVRGEQLGRSWSGCAYSMFDLHGACIFLATLRMMQGIWVTAWAPETLGFERESLTDTPVPCWMKAIYNATYTWPSGSVQLKGVGVQMILQRYHIGPELVCRFPFYSTYDIVPTALIQCYCFRALHAPVIWLMFWLNSPPAPLNYSLYMEYANIYRHDVANASSTLIMSLYPAFVGTYARVQDLAWFSSVCDSMRHIGFMVFGLSWSDLLLCGDPTQCWRSQYSYSHKIFDDMGGGSARWNQIIWYLFCKSQKRQCCCPYRKLKGDAPEKCCPPCCAGPYVEETGGCPCPCCCSSCAT